MGELFDRFLIERKAPDEGANVFQGLVRRNGCGEHLVQAIFWERAEHHSPDNEEYNGADSRALGHGAKTQLFALALREDDTGEQQNPTEAEKDGAAAGED